jgi:hypothetical protein
VTKRIASAFVLALGILALAPGVALAGPEWCDDGSPPPNDFRFRPTGPGSAGSATDWLHSTTGGTIDLSVGVNTLVGGVAHGMAEAIAHAGTTSP